MFYRDEINHLKRCRLPFVALEGVGYGCEATFLSIEGQLEEMEKKRLPVYVYVYVYLCFDWLDFHDSGFSFRVLERATRPARFLARRWRRV